MNSSIQTVPKYSYTLPFEENFDRKGTEQWLRQIYHLCFYYSAVYLVLVFLGQTYMKKRQPYDLRWALVVWNIALAVVSIGGTLRTVPELVHVLRHFGFRYSLCSTSFFYDSPVVGFWVYIFIVSKVSELFDTLFIVLRKKKLIFLHWFHHSTALIYVWTMSNEGAAMGRWLVAMNYAVHSVMYIYFALCAMGVRIPKKISVSITTLQILQMIVAFYISIHGLIMWYNQEPDCAITTNSVFFSMSLYSFYFYLFVDFFAKSYLIPKPSKALKAQ